jgi:uncharacterized protein YyaL (SSP411 family)
MRHPAGGFFSSQDADSEGAEGTFFVWSWGELVEVAGEPVAVYFGATREGNWEGTNVLWRGGPTPDGSGLDSLPAGVEDARRRLFERREERARPAADDKILAAWNGLAISAFAESGRILGEPRYVDAAVAAADFVLANARRGDGRLLRSWRDGKAGGPGYIDDYALMVEACLTLYETTLDLRFFREARGLADAMLRLFRDPDGGFFQTGSDAEALVVRPKELFDNAVPSGNSVAAGVLQRLALLTGEDGYEEAARSALLLVREPMRRAPSGFGHALCALDLHLSRALEVAVIGDPQDPGTRRLVDEVHGRFLPNAVLAVAAPGDPDATREVALLRDRPTLDGRATAYVCERFVCRRPVTEPKELAAQLAAT